MKGLLVLLLIASLAINGIYAGPIGYGVCQSGCAAVVVACYGAAGFTFGTVIAAAAPICRSIFLI
jgi:hypothetical protein